MNKKFLKTYLLIRITATDWISSEKACWFLYDGNIGR